MPAPTFLSLVELPGDGVTVNWEFNFAGGYLRREHVKALTRDEFGAPTELVLTPEDFITPSTIRIEPPVPTGHTLRIYRDTPRDAPLVNFTGGSNFTEANLDLLARQTIMCAAEAFDAGAYAEAFDLLGQAQTAASQAATALAAAIQAETESANSADEAAAAAGVATTQAALAEARRLLAESARDAAIAARDVATGARDQAVTSAGQAASSAGAAQTSATAAQTARTAAEAARDVANSSRDAAVASANTAQTQAGIATERANEAAASAAAAATFNPALYLLRSNIVGTLSAPGVAVLEVGSNSNGSYIKLAGGTMICWHTLELGSTVFSGSGTYAAPWQTPPGSWTFPTAFLAGTEPTVQASGTSNGTVSRNRALIPSWESVSNTAMNTIVLHKLTSDAINNIGTVHLVAIGRWE